MDRLFQDLRFGLRILWRDRGFAVTALLTLALCIGINAAIFAVVNSVLLRPLPVDGPERLATVYNAYPKAGVERASNGVPDYYDRLREVDAFEELALYRNAGVTIGIDGDPQRVSSMIARPSLLRMLHVKPVRGRIFTEAEGETGADRQVILTYGLWQQLYAGREDAVGTQMRINGVPHTIVGVLPSNFFFVDPAVKLWRPLSFTPEQRSDDARHSNNWSMVGRLKRGAIVRSGPAADRRAERPQPRAVPADEGGAGQCRLQDRRRIAAGRSDARCPQDAVPAVGRRALRPADRRRQHHQPRAGSLERAHEGAGDAARARRRAAAADATAAHRNDRC